MRAKAIFITILLFITALAGQAIFAQKKAAAPTAKEAKNDKREEVTGNADFMKKKWGSQSILVMKGNVKWVHEDTVLTSDAIEYNETTKTAVSTGKLTITDPECNIVGAKGSASFKKRLGVVEGSVVMNIRPKKTTEEQNAAEKDKGAVGNFKEPTTITCAKLEYQYRTKIATAIGGVNFQQGKRTAKADKAVYDGKKEILTLTGSVIAVDEDGQRFEAPDKITISMKKGDEWIEAPNAKASVKIDLGDEE